MSNNSTEDIIGTLYDMVQDARSMPLAADKCILERDRVLDLLDEVISRLPAEIKQSRTIVESRNELIAQARRRRLAPEDSTGGIATVTNFGGFGLTFAAPMPMPSESIILGVGAVTKTPVWSDEVEAFIPISKANIVATGDHRVVDGADIGRLLKRVAELLQRPEYL